MSATLIGFKWKDGIESLTWRRRWRKIKAMRFTLLYLICRLSRTRKSGPWQRPSLKSFYVCGSLSVWLIVGRNTNILLASRYALENILWISKATFNANRSGWFKKEPKSLSKKISSLGCLTTQEFIWPTNPPQMKAYSRLIEVWSSRFSTHGWSH